MPRIPGLGWYALAGAVVLAGLALGGLLVWRFVAAFEPATTFVAPGAVKLSLTTPGEYILWHEHRTVYKGRTFDLPAQMPDGTRYRVQGPDGEVALRGNASMRMEAGTEGRKGTSVSVAQFRADQPGPYVVTVEGDFEQRVMAVGPDRTWPILKLVGEVSLSVILALGAAIGVGLYGFLRTVVQPPRAAPSGEEGQASLRKLAGVVYGLQAASMLVGVTLFAGVIINYLRRGQVAGTWLESHFTWQIRTFWWSLAWCVLGIATAIVLVGVFILIGSGVWFVYRIVRGWMELNEGRPMYT